MPEDVSQHFGIYASVDLSIATLFLLGALRANTQDDSTCDVPLPDECVALCDAFGIGGQYARPPLLAWMVGGETNVNDCRRDVACFHNDAAECTAALRRLGDRISRPPCSHFPSACMANMAQCVMNSPLDWRYPPDIFGGQPCF